MHATHFDCLRLNLPGWESVSERPHIHKNKQTFDSVPFATSVLELLECLSKSKNKNPDKWQIHCDTVINRNWLYKLKTTWSSLRANRTLMPGLLEFLAVPIFL